jgi:putative DNA primase/helicase
LHGRRIVLSSETDDGSRLNEARVKAITGGDEVTGRYLFSRHDITFVPTFKLWLATNHKPTIRGSDDGIWRRIRLIPFLVSFSKEKRDRNLEGTLKQELPGILAWAVRGALDWYAQGLGEPEIVRSATSEYRDESDILGQFLREKTQQVTASSVRSAQLYDAYRAWTESNGMYTLSSVKLAKALQARGFEKKRTSQGMVWQG